MRNWVVQNFNSGLSIFELLAPIPISKLSLAILKSSKLVNSELLRQME